MMKHKSFLTSLAVILSIGLVIVPGGFAEGQAQQDDQNGVPLPVQPARIVPGDDLEMTDSAEQDCAVTIVDSPGTILEPVDLGPVTVEGWSAGDIQVVGELDLGKVRIEYRKAREESRGTISIGGTLNPSTAHLYGPYWYNAGDTVTIAITWTPASSTFRIGLIQQESGLFTGCEVTGGAGRCKLRVNQAGWYYPTVWNIGPDTATYSGFVSW